MGQGKRWKAYSNDFGPLPSSYSLVNPGGDLAGILPQIWPPSAGLLAGQVKVPAIPRGAGDTKIRNNMAVLKKITLKSRVVNFK